MYHLESEGSLVFRRTFDRYFHLSRPYIRFNLITTVSTSYQQWTLPDFRKWTRHIRLACDPFWSGCKSLTVRINDVSITVDDVDRVVDTFTTEQPHALSELDDRPFPELRDYYEDPVPTQDVMRADYPVDVYAIVNGERKLVTGNDLFTLIYMPLGTPTNTYTPTAGGVIYDQITKVAGVNFYPLLLNTKPVLTERDIRMQEGTPVGNALGFFYDSSASTYTYPVQRWEFHHKVHQELHHPLSKPWFHVQDFECITEFDPNKCIECHKLVPSSCSTVLDGPARIEWLDNPAQATHDVYTLDKTPTLVFPNVLQSSNTVTLTQVPRRVFVYAKRDGVMAIIKEMRVRTPRSTQYAFYDQEALYRVSKELGSKQRRHDFFNVGSFIVFTFEDSLELRKNSFHVEVVLETPRSYLGHYEEGSGPYVLHVCSEVRESVSLYEDGTKKRVLRPSSDGLPLGGTIVSTQFLNEGGVGDGGDDRVSDFGVEAGVPVRARVTING